jgi:hypothetical protein
MSTAALPASVAFSESSVASKILVSEVVIQACSFALVRQVVRLAIKP